MNYAIAIGISREHGVYADREASRLMKKAEAAGKKKVTKSIANPQFNAGKARKFFELISSCAEDWRSDSLKFHQQCRLKSHPSFGVSPRNSSSSDTQQCQDNAPDESDAA
jgi:ParB family chromosome partitioning protein